MIDAYTAIVLDRMWWAGKSLQEMADEPCVHLPIEQINHYLKRQLNAGRLNGRLEEAHH